MTITYGSTDGPPNHVCHRLLPHFQVGTRLQLERFEQPFVDVFRKMPENVDNYSLKLCHVFKTKYQTGV